MDEVAQEWGRRVSLAKNRSIPNDLYCGRAYKEARQASELLETELAVISAGHGLVRQGQFIAPYGLTATSGKEDSVGSKITGAGWSAPEWWQALGDNTSAQTNISELFRQVSADLILLSLSVGYARLLHRELSNLDEQTAQRLRIFGMGLEAHLPASVLNGLMPYDARLNGPDSPLRGTMSDFSSRALHHYAINHESNLIGGETASEDRFALAEMMCDWTMQSTPRRRRMTDDEVVGFVLENWAKTKGRSGVSHKLLRASGNACEQSRFRDLFKQAAVIQDSGGRIVA